MIYHGKRRWTAPLSLVGLFRGPPALHAFLPDQRYLLLDLQAWKQEAIIGGLLLRITLSMLRAIFRPSLPQDLQAIAALLRQLQDQAQREQELRRILAYATSARSELGIAELIATARAAAPDTGDTMALSLAQKLRAEGRIEGRVQGHTQGLHVAIEDALAARFGAAGLALLGPVHPLTDPQTLRQLLQAVLRAADLAELRAGWGRIMGD